MPPGQIYTNNQLIYTTTTSGLKIYDVPTEDLYAYINRNNGFSAVYGNEGTIYLGTVDDGLKTISTACISGSIDAPYDLYSCLVDFEGTLTASGIKYLHVTSNTVGVCTISGIDVIRTGPQGYSSSSTISGAQKCFVTDRHLYYTLSGSEWSLNKVPNNCDWAVPNTSYITGSGIFDVGISLNDIYVTIATGELGGNTIFCATSSGIYVIDETTKFYAIYYTR